MAVFPTAITLEMKLDGVNWTDVSRDVIGAIACPGYAIQGTGPGDRNGTTGILNFNMNNSELNSAHTLGYYTAGGASCRTGFGVGCQVRLRVTFEGQAYTVFQGRVAPGGINVVTGAKGARTTKVEVRDYFEQCAVYEIELPSISSDRSIDQVVPLITDLMPIKPAAFELNAGTDIWPFVFDTTRGKTKALTEFGKLTASELGYIFMKFGDVAGETLVVEGRLTRKNRTALRQVPQDPTLLSKRLIQGGSYRLLQDGSKRLLCDAVDVTLTNKMSSMKFTNRKLANLITFTVYPRKRDDVNTTILWSNSSELTLLTGASTTIRAKYRDPTGGGQANGIDMISPVATTDYTMFSGKGGKGSNVTANLTVAFVGQPGSDAADLILTNTSGATGYINKLQLRGRGIYLYDSTQTIKRDAGSITDNGNYPLTNDMIYQVDVGVAEALCQKWVDFYHENGMVASEVFFHANRDRTLMLAWLTFCPGTRVNIQETVSEVNADYFINGVAFTIFPAPSGKWAIDFSWMIKAAAEEDY